MKNYRFLLILIVTAGLIMLSASCNQGVTDSVSVSTLTATATDEIQAALISDDIDNELDTYVCDSVLKKYTDSTATHALTFATSGPTITIDKPDTLYPKTFTLDYGTTGITVPNGNVLKGKINVIVNNKMKLKNSVRTVTWVDLSENGIVVKGSKSSTYKGVDAAKQPFWSVNNDLAITRTDGAVVTWKSDRLRYLSGNNATPLVYSDDIYSITGSSDGVDSRGTTYNLVIRSNYPLVIGSNWPFYAYGLTSLSIKNGTVVLDYGDGIKDKNVTLLVNGDLSDYTFQ